MHLVVPNKWMSNAGAASLRRKLLEDCGLLRLSDFGACRVFESARVHTMTVLAEKKGEGGGRLVPEYRRFGGSLNDVESFLEHEPYRRFPCRKMPERASGKDCPSALQQSGIFWKRWMPAGISGWMPPRK